MSMSKLKAPVALPGEGNGKLKLEQPLETGRTIGDLPPEVLTVILEFVTLDESRNKMLGYRLVDPRWKEIVDSLLEQKLVTGKFKVFPALKIEGLRPEFLHVRCSPTMFRDGGNPFPTNSLILTGNANFNYLPVGPADTRMALPVFISSFGGNLTAFGLDNQVIGFNSLVAMLGSMPNLKVVSFKNVKLPNVIDKPGAGLSNPPALPNLKIFEAKTTWAKEEKGNILYLWLIASYADQLVSLTLLTKDEFPPLQQRHHYVYPLSRGEIFSIATTSDVAFGKLKELKLSRPTEDFLNQSKFPVLEKLSITGLANQRRVHLGTLIQFIKKCGETLEDLTLDVIWDELLGRDFILAELPRRPGVVTSSIKIVTLRYPDMELHDYFVCRQLLILFPGLEVLQLLHFSSDELPVKVKAAELDNEGKQPEEIVALNTQLALHRREVFGKERRIYREMAPFHLEGFPIHIPRYAELSRELDNLKTADRRTRAAIFKRMAALGENVGGVLVREMLDRNRAWKFNPGLKMVSVSSGSEPDGDVCLIPRPNGA